MSVSLYRKYRPQTFADVSGQKAAIDVITNSIAKSKVGHAYLFSGSRGCGKTSVARIFAKALNCLDRQQGFEPCGKCSNCTSITAGENLDVIEIDGASNNGVDEVRELKSNVTLAPFTSKYKIYIIDEVHMLSTAAFNALLKTLEEPPEHVIFILATTEPHKVPVTIRSRCQHIPFHSITPEGIFARLNYVCEHENLIAESEALWEISRQADGALRDALSLLEQVTAAGDITLQNVEATFGAGSRPAFERWIKTLREDSGEAYTRLKAMFDSVASGIRVFEEMFSLVRNLWLVSKWQNMADHLGASESEKNFLREEAKNWTPEKLHSLLDAVNRSLVQARMGVRNDILLGMFLLFMEPAPVENISLTSPLQSMQLPKQTPDPPSTDAPQKTEARVEVVEDKIKYDQQLMNEILEAAHTEKSLLYYALYDAKAYKRGNAIVIETGHLYTYITLHTEERLAYIFEFFNDYPEVFIRFNTNEFKCPPKYETFLTKAAAEDIEINQGTKKRTKDSNIFPWYENEDKKDETEASNDESENRAENDSENNQDNDKRSAFDRIRRILSNSGFSHEIVLMKRKDEAAEEDEEEINMRELDLEAEGGNDDE